MRRSLLILMALLLVGATLNVAVAWLTAMFSGTPNLKAAGSGWLGASPQVAGYWYRYRSLGRSVTACHRFDIQARGPTWIVDAYGWPLPSLSATYVDLAQLPWTVHFGIPLADSSRAGTALPTFGGWSRSTWGAPPVIPLRPTWIGFPLNSLLYAAPFILPWGAFVIRRLVRKRRHRCVSCGYPLGASLLCSECGRPASGGASRVAPA